MMRLRNSTAAWIMAAGVLVTGARAQTTPAWNAVAGYTVNLGLAGPATGPVKSVWYSPDGMSLLIQTESGRVFKTIDFQHWKLNTSDLVPPPSAKPGNRGRPESGVQIGAGTLRYSVTQDNVYVSENDRPWVDLTGFNGRSIIGGGFSAMAVSPSNALDVAAANKEGVWRSLDGGLSWHGLNDDLPNLDARSLVGQRTIALSDATLAAVAAGKWAPAEGVAPDSALRSVLASRYGVIVA